MKNVLAQPCMLKGR